MVSSKAKTLVAAISKKTFLFVKRKWKRTIELFGNEYLKR